MQRGSAPQPLEFWLCPVSRWGPKSVSETFCSKCFHSLVPHTPIPKIVENVDWYSCTLYHETVLFKNCFFFFYKQHKVKNSLSPPSHLTIMSLCLLCHLHRGGWWTWLHHAGQIPIPLGRQRRTLCHPQRGEIHSCPCNYPEQISRRHAEGVRWPVGGAWRKDHTPRVPQIPNTHLPDSSPVRGACWNWKVSVLFVVVVVVVCRMLGEVGCSYGCSMILCHLHMLRSKKLVLNVANAGMYIHV